MSCLSMCPAYVSCLRMLSGTHLVTLIALPNTTEFLRSLQNIGRQTLHLGDKLVRVQVRLQLAELDVAGGLGFSILLQGARFVFHMPRLLAEEQHVFRAFHQGFVARFLLLCPKSTWP